MNDKYCDFCDDELEGKKVTSPFGPFVEQDTLLFSDGIYEFEDGITQVLCRDCAHGMWINDFEGPKIIHPPVESFA